MQFEWRCILLLRSVRRRRRVSEPVAHFGDSAFSLLLMRICARRFVESHNRQDRRFGKFVLISCYLCVSTALKGF